jgi:hypothetical protein
MFPVSWRFAVTSTASRIHSSREGSRGRTERRCNSEKPSEENDGKDRPTTTSVLFVNTATGAAIVRRVALVDPTKLQPGVSGLGVAPLANPQHVASPGSVDPSSGRPTLAPSRGMHPELERGHDAVVIGVLRQNRLSSKGRAKGLKPGFSNDGLPFAPEWRVKRRLLNQAWRLPDTSGT